MPSLPLFLLLAKLWARNVSSGMQFARLTNRNHLSTCSWKNGAENSAFVVPTPAPAARPKHR
eukprot:1918910-Pyramimonas_sp.AAC.1